ncbi:MAG: hypothetical protein JO097_07690 [Acidobacteriaceae bacterium]|nr:hypothetical protein [Acidobacteriaceae bacterium]
MNRNVVGVIIIVLLAISDIPAQTQYVRGPKGGCYEVTQNGGKKSVERRLCDSKTDKQGQENDTSSSAKQAAQNQADDKKVASRSPDTQTAQHRTEHTKDGRTYVTGPKGGCYYVAPSGKKQYVDHSKCQ